VGGVLGGVFGTILLSSLGFLYYRRRKRSKSTSTSFSGPTSMAKPLSSNSNTSPTTHLPPPYPSASGNSQLNDFNSSINSTNNPNNNISNSHSSDFSNVPSTQPQSVSPQLSDRVSQAENLGFHRASYVDRSANSNSNNDVLSTGEFLGPTGLAPVALSSHLSQNGDSPRRDPSSEVSYQPSSSSPLPNPVIPTTTPYDNTSNLTNNGELNPSMEHGGYIANDPRKKIAVHDYDPQMDDELAVNAGDSLLILEEFPDGWVMIFLLLLFAFLSIFILFF